MAVNTLVCLALFQFTTVTFYRIFLCRRFKDISLIAVVRKSLSFAKHLSFIKTASSITQQEIEMQNTTQEVQPNYEEFQEPLIGYDNSQD